MQCSQQLQMDFNDVKEFLMALGDEKRQAIIVTLLQQPTCKGLRVTDLTEATQLSRPAVSHHLKILKQAGVVDVKSEGTKNYYYLSPDTSEIDKMLQLLQQVKLLIHTKQAIVIQEK